jgi:endogenous inhibitor of DNA gyrase (YacG/DUF329 family)
MSERSTPLRVVRMAAKCPICGKEGVQAYRPFCSKRCADIDLGRWLKESYRVPAEEAPGDDDGPGGEGPGRRGPTGQAR